MKRWGEKKSLLIETYRQNHEKLYKGVLKKTRRMGEKINHVVCQQQWLEDKNEQLTLDMEKRDNLISELMHRVRVLEAKLTHGAVSVSERPRVGGNGV